MSECHHSHGNSSVHQTLDELDFERGIWYAAQQNDLPRVEKLVNQGTDVNKPDKSGYTALHYASRNGHYEICKFLISKRTNVNALTKAGRASPLHRCAAAGHINIFKLLMDHYADITLQDGDGKTVLHRAIEGKHVKLIETIISINSQLLNIADNKGKTPQQYLQSSELNVNLPLSTV